MVEYFQWNIEALLPIKTAERADFAIATLSYDG